MLEKRKRRVKMIILSVLCAALMGVSVTEGILYFQVRRDYRILQSQQIEVEKEYKDAISQLEEKEEKIAGLEKNVKQLNQQVQDTRLIVGEFIREDEIVNIDKYFTFSVIERDGEIFNRINGKSYRDNNDISLESLRYLTIPYYNFEHQIQLGEMIVNVDIQNDVINIFKELFKNEYEIKSMRLIDDYWGEGGDGNNADNNSVEDNNTSCFCYRTVTGGENISNHGYGRAIDINPQQNPYVDNGEISHVNAEQYVDRFCGDPHVIVASEQDICYSTFTKYGFSWGGNWNNPVDYQHFEKEKPEG